MHPWCCAVQLGRTKIFFRAGKGQVLEDLAERDLAEVIPLLVAKLKQWGTRKAAQVRLQSCARRFICTRRLVRAKYLVRSIQHRRRSQLLFYAYRKRHLAWAAKREREAAEKKRVEEEERRLAAEAAAKQAAQNTIESN